MKRVEGNCSGTKSFYILANNRFDEVNRYEDKFNILTGIDKQTPRTIQLTFKYSSKRREPANATVELGNLKTEKKVDLIFVTMYLQACRETLSWNIG